MGSGAEGDRVGAFPTSSQTTQWVEGAGRLSRNLDKGQPKGLMTPGNPKMELRDPENQEDGDPEVRDGNKGRRERERDKEVDAERNREQGHGAGGSRRGMEKETEEPEKQGNIRDSE